MFKPNLVRRVKPSVQIKDANGKSDLNKVSSQDPTFSENMHEYLDNSSLHGLKYIGNTKITLFERIFFGLSFILVVALSFYYISNVYEKWSASPIIVTMGSSFTSIMDLPFPAVTICNINKARESVVSKFKADSIESIWLQNVCFDENDNISTKQGDLPEGSNEWSMFRRYLLEISQPCSKMLLTCRYALDTFECMEMFDTVLSDEGLCCIFNPVDPEFLYNNPLNTSFDDDEDQNDVIPVDWTPEKGYIDLSIKKKSSPRPGAGAGSHLGMYVILNGDLLDYYCSSTNSAGFKLLLHNPIETPRIKDFGMFISPGKETRIIVKPRIQTASRLLKNIPIAKRQCIFTSESNLSYFRTYSRKNCEMECYSRIVEQACGCVIYYFPKVNPDAKICSHADSKCYNYARIMIERGDNSQTKCDCMPGCDELSFTGEISSAPLTTMHYRKENSLANYTAETIRRDIAIVQVFYTESLFRSLVKDELIGFTEFLSNTGGLLGLFMGFSVVSLVEIVYFVALRPYCRRFYHGRRNQSKKMQTISKLVFKNQRQKWPFVWAHGHEMEPTKPHQNPMQLAHNRFYNGRNPAKNEYNPSSYPIIYPYID